jgi:hypothetical protein
MCGESPHPKFKLRLNFDLAPQAAGQSHLPIMLRVGASVFPQTVMPGLVPGIHVLVSL